MLTPRCSLNLDCAATVCIAAAPDRPVGSISETLAVALSSDLLFETIAESIRGGAFFQRLQRSQQVV